MTYWQLLELRRINDVLSRLAAGRGGCGWCGPRPRAGPRPHAWTAPESEKAKKSPVATSHKVAEQGEKVARVNCVSCHGKSGKGAPRSGPRSSKDLAVALPRIFFEVQSAGFGFSAAAAAPSPLPLFPWQETQLTRATFSPCSATLWLAATGLFLAFSDSGAVQGVWAEAVPARTRPTPTAATTTARQTTERIVDSPLSSSSSRSYTKDRPSRARPV